MSAFTDTGRSGSLEKERTDTERALEAVPAPVKFLPDVLTSLVKRFRELTEDLERLAENPAATREDMEAARSNIHALLGTVTLKRRDGFLGLTLPQTQKASPK